MNESKPYQKEFTKFIPYLRSVDIVTRSLIKRIELICTLCTDMCPDKLEDIFVTDYVSKEGTREYENLWFFSKSYCLEAKKFMTEITLDIAPFKNNIAAWAISTQDFNFKKASTKSRLSLHLKFSTTATSGLTASFKASGKNCEALQSIINRYVKSYLITP